jgi:hypothetical protein
MAGSENSGPVNNAADATKGGLLPVVGTSGTDRSSFSSTSRSKTVNTTPKESAFTQLDQQMIAMFGRRATAAEKNAYFKALNKAEKKYATRNSQRQSGGGSSTTDASGNTVRSNSDSSSSKTTSFSFDNNAFLYEFTVGLAKQYIQEGQQIGGIAGQTINNLKTYAADMGVTLTDASAIGTSLDIIMGKTDENAQKESFRKRAISLYGGLAERLTQDPTLTVRDAASDYIETMATMLDINPRNISLTDNTLAKALTATTKEGKPYTKTINEFRADLRGDTRFQYSTMAQQEAKNLGSSFAKAFGFGA